MSRDVILDSSKFGSRVARSPLDGIIFYRISRDVILDSIKFCRVSREVILDSIYFYGVLREVILDNTTFYYVSMYQNKFYCKLRFKTSNIILFIYLSCCATSLQHLIAFGTNSTWLVYCSFAFRAKV